MLVILANRYDVAAGALVGRWGAHKARLLSCEDLSIAGWRYCLPDPGASTAVVEGCIFDIEEIVGVLTLLPCVIPDQLVHIVPEDRAYVAAEMTAFLVAWLSELACPVLNRPTPACLTGPNWRQEQWVNTAARAGIPVRSVTRRVALSADTVTQNAETAPTTVTVIGEYCFGEVNDALAMHARRLAKLAGADMLAVHFDGPEAYARLLGVDLRPDLTSPKITDAILAKLNRSRGC
jgi:hypothetical protein